MKKPVIIFGGAFNPPTNAHVTITQAAADFAESIEGELWLMPSGNRADKYIDTTMEQRLSYLYGMMASVATTATMRVVDYELKSREYTETCNTDRYFTKTYPDNEFYWLYGSDAISWMDEWHEGYRLKNHRNLLVIMRPGFEIELQDNMHLLDVQLDGTSSTEVRRRMAAGEPYSDLVPATVEPLLDKR